MEIRIEGLWKRFGDTVALRDINMRVNDGELMGILGPSGSGKTTLIRTIAGLVRPDKGRIFFNDRDVSDMPPEKRGVGMVFQNYALFPHMNVEDNIGFGLAVRGKKRDDIEKRVKELLNLVGLEGYEKRRIDELSGGEMQRVALARALAPGVDILLLDEPLAALDAKLRDSLKKEIRRIQRELGITAIYVTHDQREALSVSDRVAVMNKGRIEQIGTPDEVYFRPETEFVAKFVGEGNIIHGRFADGHIITPLGKIPANGISENEEVKILIRPENILFEPVENALKIRGKVVETESAGGEIYGRISFNGIELMFRRYAGEVNVKKGMDADVFIPYDRVFIIGRRKGDETERDR